MEETPEHHLASIITLKSHSEQVIDLINSVYLTLWIAYTISYIIKYFKLLIIHYKIELFVPRPIDIYLFTDHLCQIQNTRLKSVTEIYND